MIGLHDLNNQVAILLVDFDVWCGMYVARLFFRERVDLCASRQWRIQAGEGEGGRQGRVSPRSQFHSFS